jgi:hypothetical protein
MNNLPVPQVLKSVDVTVNSFNLDGEDVLGEADIDVCLAFLDSSTQDLVGIRNGVEQFCFAQHKTDTTSNWPETSIHIEFPGQGLMLESGTYTFCSAQGVVPEGDQDNRTYLADFSCTLTLENADMESSLRPVQSIRVPYIDEKFTAQISTASVHENLTSESREVLGYSSYIVSPSSFKHTSNEISHYIYKRTFSSSWEIISEISPPPLDSDFVVGNAIINQSIQFNTNDQITAQCDVFGENAESTICATYFYVSIPIVDQSWSPMCLNRTILYKEAEAFCNRENFHYFLTDETVDGVLNDPGGPNY